MRKHKRRLEVFLQAGTTEVLWCSETKKKAKKNKKLCFPLEFGSIKTKTFCIVRSFSCSRVCVCVSLGCLWVARKYEGRKVAIRNRAKPLRFWDPFPVRPFSIVCRVSLFPLVPGFYFSWYLIASPFPPASRFPLGNEKG